MLEPRVVFFGVIVSAFLGGCATESPSIGSSTDRAPAAIRPPSCVQNLVRFLYPDAKRVVARFSGALEHLDAKIAAEIRYELLEIAKNSLSNSSDEKMSGADFNKVFLALQEFATKYNIQFEQTSGAIGVFPAGLNKLKLSGFGRLSTKPEASIIEKHELGHLFHTLQIRANLIVALEQVRSEDRPIVRQQIDQLLRHLESNGANYRQFEKMVGSMSSFGHLMRSESQSNALYLQKLETLLAFSEKGLFEAHVKFPTGKNMEDLYALFLSKMPLFLGTSLTEFSYKMPINIFAILYLANVPFEPRQFGLPVLEETSNPDLGFRDYVNGLVAEKI